MDLGKLVKGPFKKCLVFLLTISLAVGETETTEVVEVSVETKAPAADIVPSLDDITLLKDQLNLQGVQIEDVLKQLQALDGLTKLLEGQQLGMTKNLTDLTGSLSSVLSNVQTLDLADTNLSNQLNSTTSKLSKFDSSVAAVEKNTASLSTAVGGMKGMMNRMGASVRQMANVNQIWRNNFRLANTTFRHIRKKVMFPLPTFGLGPAKGVDPVGPSPAAGEDEADGMRLRRNA